jgi:nucleotide-binding universal stress UspA family protein
MSGKGHVVVATDGSSHSHRVLPHASLLAQALGSRLLLLRIIDPKADVHHQLGESHDAALEHARERFSLDLTSTLARLGLYGAVSVADRREGEKTSRSLLRASIDAGASVVAMDSRGHGALRHVLHGSVTMEVVGATSLPVMLTGPNLEGAMANHAPYRILLTSDGSPASRAAVEALAPLLDNGPFQVTLMRVHEHAPAGEDDTAQLDECAAQLEGLRELLPPSLPVKTLVREIPRGGGIDTAIIEQALESSAHAIALSTQGVSARRHLLMGSVATTLLGRSPLPLILVRSELKV